MLPSSAQGPPFGAATDCAMRSLALRHVQAQLAGALSQADLRHVFEALELARCNVTHPAPPSSRPPPASPTDAVFVSYASGSDSSSGDVHAPLKTVAAALDRVAARGPGGTIVLRQGVHFLDAALELGTRHSNLLVTAFCSGASPCERVWLSGGLELAPSAGWRPHELGSGRNIWSAAVPSAVVEAGAIAQSSLHWLDDLEGGTALTRARWPNRRPRDGTIDRPSLLDIAATNAVWTQKRTLKTAMHKEVRQPSIPLSVSGEFNRWMAGIGGECDRFTPPVGAICHPNATGGGYNWDGPGPYFPTGLRLGNASALFPNSSRWHDVSQAVLTSWTNGWFTSHFDIAAFDNGTLVFGPRGGTQGGRGWHFPGPTRPGETPQICTGDVRKTDCGPLKVEGLLAELDQADEFHFDRTTSRLFLFYNASSGTPPPPQRVLVVPRLPTLITVRGRYPGPAAASRPTVPTANVTLRGIGFRDSAVTVLDPRGIPSGARPRV